MFLWIQCALPVLGLKSKMAAFLLFFLNNSKTIKISKFVLETKKNVHILSVNVSYLSLRRSPPPPMLARALLRRSPPLPLLPPEKLLSRGSSDFRQQDIISFFLILQSVTNRCIDNTWYPPSPYLESVTNHLPTSFSQKPPTPVLHSHTRFVAGVAD